MPARTGYNKASVDRALDVHVKNRWKMNDAGTRYLIDTHNIGTVEFTLAQAFAFCVGCSDATKRRPT